MPLRPVPICLLWVLCAAKTWGAHKAPRPNGDSLVVLDPNRGDTWTKGGSYGILWTSYSDEIALCSTLQVSLFHGSQMVDLTTTENDGAALFYVKSTLPDGKDYSVSLSCVEPTELRTALVGRSDTFSVESAVKAAFSVSSESTEWPVGTEQRVKWALAQPVQASVACERVDVLLLGHNGAERRVVSSEMNILASESNGHEFYVSGDMQPGTYAVRVQCSGDTSLGGESGSFRITPNADALLLVGPKQGAALIGVEEEVANSTLAMLGAHERSVLAKPCGDNGHVSAGLSHSCAITAAGGLLCWGSNIEGQLDVPQGRTWLQVSAGMTHTCGITTERTLECWGGKQRWTPVSHHQAALPQGELWESVSAGHAFSCALTMSRRVYCWGRDTELSASRPPHGLLWRTVSVGEAHACGITTNGAAVCWGDDSVSQATVPDREEWHMVATHHRHSCGVTAAGELLCWGANEKGQCDVPRGFRWAAVATGHSHSCALTVDRLMRCFGHLPFGLRNVPPDYRWAELGVGLYHACGLVHDEGELLCWGENYHGETDLPMGFRFWQGCDQLGEAALHAVESEYKPGKLACPQHELLSSACCFASRDAVELRCAEVNCASFTWLREVLVGQDDEGRAFFCKHDYWEQTANAPQFPEWEAGRPVTGCAPKENDLKLSSYPAGELLSYLAGAWGTVCRAGFGNGGHELAAANVACRQLGYERAIRTYEYEGASHTAQSVRGVRCTGDEAKLADCAPVSDPSVCNHVYGDIGLHCISPADVPAPSPCGSGHAATIRTDAADARALLLHGSVAVGSEAPHAFDGQLRYTSGGFQSHGRLRAEPDRRAHQAMQERGGNAHALVSVMCTCMLAALAIAGLRMWRRLPRDDPQKIAILSISRLL